MRRIAVFLTTIVAAGIAPGLVAAQEPVTTICHATGTGTYVELTLPETALAPHRAHPADVIPAPAGGCSAYYAVPTATPTPLADERPAADDDVDREPPADEDAGVEETTGAPGGGGGGLSPTRPLEGLPATGAEPALIGLAGIGLLMMGLGLAATVRPPRRMPRA